MRTISTAEDKVLTATGGRSTFFRVKVKDSGGTFRDLSTYAGQNLCIDATWKETVDTPGLEADITLKREVEKISLAPLMAGSPLNLAFAYPGTYAKLIDLFREVQLEVAVVPDGIAPASGDWNLAFHGYIDEIDPASGAHLLLRCSDKQALLRDTYIERERAYGLAQGASATTGCVYWRPTDTLAVGVRGVPTEANKNLHFYRVTSITTGITGSTEPVWPTGAAATVVDGGVTWTESGATSLTTGTNVETVMQQILDDNVGGVTLNVPVSPGWAIKAYKLDRQSVWDALTVLSNQMGWDLRYRWDSGSSTYKLTLSAPNRAAVTPDRTFTPSQRYKLSKLTTQVAMIRNVVQVVYSNSANKDAAGRPIRTTVVRTNSASITAYGRRFCEVAEGTTSNIDTSTEANTLADNILSDLANPIAEHECDVPLFRFVELGDYYQWNADGIHYDSDQKFGVVGYSHRVTAGDRPQARTTITCRGLPSAGASRWHETFDRDRHALDLDNTSSGTTLSASSVVGGTRLSLTATEAKGALPMEAEIHVGTSSGFTPDNTTIVSQGTKSEVVLANLLPGNTYYAKVVPSGHNRTRLVKGQPSAATSFVAGRASSGHIQSGIALGDYPLNGGFETRLDGSGLPDHWVMYGGVLNTDVQVMTDGNGMSGGSYMRLLTKNGGITSAIFPIIQEAMETNRYGGLYRLSWWRNAGSSNSAGATYDILVRLLDASGNEVNNLTVFTARPCDDNKGHWMIEDGFVELRAGDASARQAQLRIIGRAGATFQLDFDEFRVQFCGSPWFYVGDTTKFTDNYLAIPAFQNAWANFDAGTHTKAAFRRDQFGRVHLKGFVKSGTINSIVYTLPAGFRPSPSNWNSAGKKSETNTERIEVDTGGNVSILAGDNTYVSLDGISFLAGY